MRIKDATKNTVAKRPVKTEGYANAPFGAARRAVRQAEAKSRQAKYDALTVAERDARDIRLQREYDAKHPTI